MLHGAVSVLHSFAYKNHERVENQNFSRGGGVLSLTAEHICKDGEGTILANFSATEGRVF